MSIRKALDKEMRINSRDRKYVEAMAWNVNDEILRYKSRNLLDAGLNGNLREIGNLEALLEKAEL